MVHMTRDELKECIETGITHAQDPGRTFRLTDRDAAKLRGVGETITHVAYGDWCQSNSVSCGCPLVEASLVSVGSDGKPIPMHSNPEYTSFANWYDSAVIVWSAEEADISISGMGIIVVEEEVNA